MPLSLGITLSPRVIPILQISFDGKGKERKGKEGTSLLDASKILEFHGDE